MSFRNFLGLRCPIALETRADAVARILKAYPISGYKLDPDRHLTANRFGTTFFIPVQPGRVGTLEDRGYWVSACGVRLHDKNGRPAVQVNVFWSGEPTVLAEPGHEDTAMHIAALIRSEGCYILPLPISQAQLS